MFIVTGIRGVVGFPLPPFLAFKVKSNKRSWVANLLHQRDSYHTELWLTLLESFVFLTGGMSIGVKLERLVLSRLLPFIILLVLVFD